jgi:hypothetical protein
LNYFKNTCWQRSTRDLNDAKEAELCAIAEDCFKDIKDESMKEVAKAQYVTDALDKNSAIVCDLVLVKEKFGGSKDDLYSRYNDQMNHVVKNVLFFHPGLLQKRIIVFPSNLRNNHWGQHLFSMLVTSLLRLMTHHRVRAGFVFLLLQSSSLWHDKDSKQDGNHLVP